MLSHPRSVLEPGDAIAYPRAALRCAMPLGRTQQPTLLDAWLNNAQDSGRVAALVPCPLATHGVDRMTSLPVIARHADQAPDGS
jgi:hypothetical protein